VDLVSARIDRALDEQRDRLAAISPDLVPFDTFARDLLSGGKRFRALFCYWGWQSVAGRSGSFDPLSEGARQTTAEAIVTAAAALEVFHAAALVHDDIMDRSDTRRGRPAAHRRFESLHADSAWVGDRGLYGTNAALLLGDLLLALSDSLFDEALALLDPVRARIVRQEFHTMRLEVTAGQYLDIHEETAWPTVDDAEQLVRAQRVIVFKSAKYSVEAPLLIGALIAGASESQLDGLRSFGLPLGVAYQLRDDMLGVFGDPEVTGKPAGDDLREGKRTVLVATARKSLPVGARQLLDELLGDPDLDDDQVQMLRATLTDSGAVTAVERSIDRHVQRAKAALDAAPLTPSAREQLASLADTVSRRSA
jgi:geranylgeranyl diphosphate synthase type I